MKKDLDRIIKLLGEAKKVAEKGGEYWVGRDIQHILAYSSWEKFKNVLTKAMSACDSTGIDIKDHFYQTGEMVSVGSGAMVQREDYFLTRYACYLIAMNGNSAKSEVGTAQTYFAVQTRRQELKDQLTAGERRLELRERVRDRNLSLNETAQKAGVQRFGLFHDAGYRGLYEMGLADIKKVKGLPPKANLLDLAGRAELAANEFRITQTEEKIVREEIKGERNTIKAHHTVAKKVRDAIKELGGTMPEHLPSEPSVKKLKSVLKDTKLVLEEEASV